MNRMTKPAQPEQPGAVIHPTDTTDWARFMTDDEYYPFLVKRNIRPAIWRWRDLEPRLSAVAQDKLRRADRRFVALVNSDTGALAIRRARLSRWKEEPFQLKGLITAAFWRLLHRRR